MGDVLTLPVVNFRLHFERSIAPFKAQDVCVLCTKSEAEKKQVIDVVAASLSVVASQNDKMKKLLHADASENLKRALSKATLGFEIVGPNDAIRNAWRTDLETTAERLANLAMGKLPQRQV